MKDIFIIIGAQRSGTTYLYNLLDEHPEICMSKPVKPEPKFFLNKSAGEIDLEAYLGTYFKHCSSDHKILGEKSTSYYEDEKVPVLISKSLPGSKILMILRNPAQRAISNYFFSVNNGLESRSLNEVFIEKKPPPLRDKQKTSVDPFNYLGRGDYAKFIIRFKKFFSEDQFRILIFEELINNKDHIRGLYRFLGVNENFVPSMIDEKINPSSKNELVSREVRDALNAYYMKRNEELERLIRIDLSVWDI